jgi:hypothetical protein
MDTLTLILLLAGAAVVTGGGYLWMRRPPVRVELYHHFQCPHCSRKLKYKARKAGQPGVCPRCKKGCTFPLVPQSAQETEQDE